MVTTIIILAITTLIAAIAIRNLMIKVERYEDITVDQAKYLQNISELIKDSINIF